MLDFLDQHQPIINLAVLIAGFVVLSLCEVLFPRRRPPNPMGWRWLNNISLTLITFFVAHNAQILLSLLAAWWASSAKIGLFQVWQPGWAYTIIITLLVLDFSNYVYHRLLHRTPLLWRLHAVHHSDTEFDLTTTYRNHPLVAIFLISVRMPVIVLLGAPVYVIIIYGLYNIASDLFSHSNVKIPERVDRLLRYFIVTPDFHRAHHSSTKCFTDSNFATMFPLFDHLFGTASDKPYAEHEELEIGLEYLRSPRDTRLDQLLLMPFKNFE